MQSESICSTLVSDSLTRMEFEVTNCDLKDLLGFAAENGSWKCSHRENVAGDGGRLFKTFVGTW